MRMDHRYAKAIFEEIRDRPYRLSDKAGVHADNCFFKGQELIQRLGTLGYCVRGRIGEMNWHNGIIPEPLIQAIPDDIVPTHFYVEVYRDQAWHILDASLQMPLEKLGFKIGQWDQGQSCFEIISLYDQQESIAYQEKWLDPDMQKTFFARTGHVWKNLDAWFVSQHEALTSQSLK